MSRTLVTTTFSDIPTLNFEFIDSPLILQMFCRPTGVSEVICMACFRVAVFMCNVRVVVVVNL